MPIYEYLCEGCGRITEVMHKISERGPAACTECGSDRIARLVSRSAFQLKGGGWYADLYASKKDAGKAGDAGASKDATAPKSESAGGKSEAGAKSEAAGAGEKKPAASGSNGGGAKS